MNERIERLRRQMKYRQIRRIESMEPGRRLDALVAKYVMGYHVEEWKDPSDESVDYWYIPHASKFRQLEGTEPERVPNYSTAIYPALHVLERFPVWKMEGDNTRGEVAALLSHAPEHGIWIRGCRSTPEAICKAALIGLVEANRLLDQLLEEEE